MLLAHYVPYCEAVRFSFSFSFFYGIVFCLVSRSMLCAVAVVGLTWLPEVCEKGDFPLAEWNEISGKCFSHTPLGPGDGSRSCDM